MISHRDLREWMEEKGLTTKDVAQMLNVTPRTVRNWLNPNWPGRMKRENEERLLSFMGVKYIPLKEADKIDSLLEPIYVFLQDAVRTGCKIRLSMEEKGISFGRLAFNIAAMEGKLKVYSGQQLREDPIKLKELQESWRKARLKREVFGRPTPRVEPSYLDRLIQRLEEICLGYGRVKLREIVLIARALDVPVSSLWVCPRDAGEAFRKFARISLRTDQRANELLNKLREVIGLELS